MTPSLVFMFSGQGSQYYGMAQCLFNDWDPFRKTAKKLDALAADLLGGSVLERLYREGQTGQLFSKTRYTHPAIFIVEYALARALMDDGVIPDAVLGVSLGEFAAAAVAGVMCPEKALEAVLRQANMVEEHCLPGAMTAILHHPTLYRESHELRKAELAGINYQEHFVVAGSLETLEGGHRFLKAKGIPFQRLPVSHAFHSRLIDPAFKPYHEYLASQSFAVSTLPYFSCAIGERVEEMVSEHLWSAVRRPILFGETLAQVEREGPRLYVDLGPGGTLAGFARRNLAPGSRSESLSLVTAFHQELKNLVTLRRTLATNRSGAERNTSMKTLVFPGQGSQQKGMGAGLFDDFPEVTALADAVLGYSIKTLCLEDPHQQLTQTQFTQPALYTVNALSYLKLSQQTGQKPDYVAGHSLGEYNALFAAGVFDFETGLRLVQKRGELMSQATGGGMAAVIGLTPDKVQEVLQENGVQGIDMANFNAPSQTVIAGIKEEILRVAPIFEQMEVMYIPLNVSGAFHSRYMAPSADEFRNFLEGFSFCEPSLPVISNVTARPYRNGEVKINLVAQITSSVRWSETIRYLMGRGEMEFQEVGPGNVLTRMTQTIRREAEPLLVEDEEGVEKADSIILGAAPSVEIVSPPVRVQEFDDASDTCSPVPSETLPVTNCAAAAPSTAGNETGAITAATLGCAGFKKEYNLAYAYLAGSMYRGISSPEMVVRLGKAGILGFFGAGGLSLAELEQGILSIRDQLRNGEPYGINLLHNLLDPQREEQKVDLFVRHGVSTIEASAFLSVTTALARYRALGLSEDGGVIRRAHRIIAKVSRPEVAEAFMSPAPERLVAKLLAENRISTEQARLLALVPVADDICVEADSGGHTDAGVAYALMPAMLTLRDDMMKKYDYQRRIRVGAAGGIGTPEAAAAAFVLGADFILTGSINQCTVEAGTSERAKELLQQMNVQDTDYAPAGELFELGGKVQVLKKGLFFAARANKLYELYRQHESLDQIDEKTRAQLQEKYFRCSFEEFFQRAKGQFSPAEIDKSERSPKQRMALTFRAYFNHGARLALTGSEEHKVDYQILCGPALGAFNQWVRGTELEDWRKRHVDQIGTRLMSETAQLLNRRFQTLSGGAVA